MSRWEGVRHEHVGCITCVAATVGRARWQVARSLTTLLVVGATGESDRELLDATEQAHCELGLWLAYFSAFRPIARLPLADHPAEDPTRVLRLYHSDFMLRDYGFN